jgi:hypothetical protein
VSLTVILKLHCDPAPVVQMTVLMPLGKKKPIGGEQDSVPQFPESSGMG